MYEYYFRVVKTIFFHIFISENIENTSVLVDGKTRINICILIKELKTHNVLLLHLTIKNETN